MPPSAPIVLRAGHCVVHVNDRTMLAETMQAMATVLPPARSHADVERNHDTTALEQFERAMAFIRAAAGQSLSSGGASKWLREAGRSDLSNVLRSAMRQRNGFARLTDLQTIEDFVTEWVASVETDDVEAPLADWRAEDLRDDRELRRPPQAQVLGMRRVTPSTLPSCMDGGQSFCRMTDHIGMQLRRLSLGPAGTIMVGRAHTTRMQAAHRRRLYDMFESRRYNRSLT